MHLENLINKKYNKLLVLSYAGHQKWNCLCDCGSTCIKSGYSLTHNRVVDCGIKGKHPKIDMTNTNIGNWHIDKFLGGDMWLCTCKCGTQKQVSGYLLRQGKSKSCGCSKFENNRLSNTNFDLSEWNYTKNVINPTDISAHSKEKVWWICKQGHSYQQSVANKFDLNQSCPYCSGKLAIMGYNDLITLYPNIAKEFDVERNKPILLETLKPQSNIKIWWKCKFGHSWQTAPYNRIKGHNCPYCNNEKRKSFPECAIFYYLYQIDNTILHNDTSLGFELDVYIPNKHIGIEYDGANWHQDRDRDLRKNKKCEDIGITLIRIREQPLTILNSTSEDYIVSNEEELTNIIQIIIKQVYKQDIAINIDKDRTQIEKLKLSSPKERSLAFCRPDLSQEFDIEKNGGITPNDVYMGSNKKYWWTCNKGHTYRMTPYEKQSLKQCPYCSGRRGRKIKNIDTNEIFDTQIEAAKSINGHPEAIYRCCLGLLNKTGNYHWQYVYEKDEWTQWLERNNMKNNVIENGGGKDGE